MFLLEDLEWRLADAAAGPFDRLPPDLVHELRHAMRVSMVADPKLRV
jgi:hypothetical protein